MGVVLSGRVHDTYYPAILIEKRRVFYSEGITGAGWSKRSETQGARVHRGAWAVHKVEFEPDQESHGISCMSRSLGSILEHHFLPHPRSSYVLSCPAWKRSSYLTNIWDVCTVFLCFSLSFLFNIHLLFTFTAIPLQVGGCP